MTKDQMRQLLADLVPAAIADGRAYVVRRPAASSVRELPNAEAIPNVRPPRPRRMFIRQGVHGAGFEVPTYKPFQINNSPDLNPVATAIYAAPLHQPYFCHVCDRSGADCTC